MKRARPEDLHREPVPLAVPRREPIVLAVPHLDLAKLVSNCVEEHAPHALENGTDDVEEAMSFVRKEAEDGLRQPKRRDQCRKSRFASDRLSNFVASGATLHHTAS